jgi:hypothetical protein
MAVAVFIVSVAVDGYTRIVECGNVIPELEQAAAAPLAAVLGWLGNPAIKLALAVAFLMFGFFFSIGP